MKGFIDHIIKSDAQLVRELERDFKGIEVPYKAEAFKEWVRRQRSLEENNDKCDNYGKDSKSESLANSYISYLKSIDNDLFLFEEDFFGQLQEHFESRDSVKITQLFDTYAAIIDKSLEDARKEDTGISAKSISNWRSGFRKYRSFIMDSLDSLNSRQQTEDCNPADSSRADSQKVNVIAADSFSRWMCENGKNSVASYISYLVMIDRDIYRVQNAGADLFKTVAGLLGRSDNAGVLSLLYGFDRVLTGMIESKDDSLMNVSTMSKCRSALRSYIQFMQEEVLADLPDEEEQDEQERKELQARQNEYKKHEEHKKYDEQGGHENYRERKKQGVCGRSKTSNLAVKASCDVFDYEILSKNFWFRLVTQNRMGEDKNVFYPIAMLRRLFRKAGEYRWFNEWVYTNVSDIRVITDMGEFPLSALNDKRTLVVNRATGKVTAFLKDKTEVDVMTETEIYGADPVPMIADKLKFIHIDHTPLISNLLSEKARELPALGKLTEFVKDAAVGLDIVSRNFCKIARLTLDKHFEDMKPMIPELKNELELIRKESVLKLMSATYNLRKKK